MTKRLEGLAAIVTGGAGGIGTAVGLLFCEEGASVLLVDRDRDATEAAAHAIREQVPGARVAHAGLDLATEAAAAEAVALSKEAFGRLDCVVNNAGIRAYEPLAEARAETWHAIIAVNLLSYAYLAREALPDLRASPAASIVNVSSTHAFNPRAGMGQYDVTKAGIVSLTRTLAAEEASRGVRVNAVCPGPTLTPFHIRRGEADGRSRGDLETERRRDCLMERWGTPREAAYPILWLASPEASFVTGTAIMVDGGMPVI
ncbi:Dihydroanticapsin 7-dehydrogenase [Methylobacterium crusticola]|uniref:Dihydroanticapsin 7-dehydrogenase n=1 Tax=Methylobacterium crusticola TaxID=1697972 RepID=A0ABQ4R841_9HYPH|nr:SDR family oxidoreductase [Methylobacterium crusticola]GJD52969.1 Dihydroanticapsin 7-dehydrogenase [Methylobacterium crusticola]